MLLNERSACLEMTPNTVSNRRLIARVCKPPEFCDRNSCIRKCCAEDEFFYPNKFTCNKLATPEEPTEFHEAFASAVNQTESSAFNSNDYGVLIGNPCQNGMYPVHPSEDTWSLTSEGHLLIEGYPIYYHDSYCMDIFYNNSIASFDREFFLFICFSDPVVHDHPNFQVNSALEIISCMFLLITLLVYACLPSLQNLHGKTLMCHVSSLLLAFTCLAIITWTTPGSPFDIQEEKEPATRTCKALAYIMLFCFLSSFSWLNVMCFDIWWTFGILRGGTITKARGHRKKFLLYCLYAWGFSFVVTILTIVADRTDVLPVYLRPDIGNTGCWFTHGLISYGELTFFIGPVTVQLIVNIVFFTLTAVHCNKVKAEIRRMTTDPADPRSKRFHSDRIRFMINIKLFIVMGISWICEVVSFLLKKYLEDGSWHHMIFYASDVFNLLQGLLIFILFVLKNRVYQALRKRLGLGNNKNPNPTCNATLRTPHKVRKSASNSTLTTTFAISSAP